MQFGLTHFLTDDLSCWHFRGSPFVSSIYSSILFIHSLFSILNSSQLSLCASFFIHLLPYDFSPCVIFPFFCMTLSLSLSTLLSPPFFISQHSLQRNLQKSTLSISLMSQVISLWIYLICGSHRNSLWPCGNAEERVRASLMLLNEAMLLPSTVPSPLMQAFLFISGCLLAGCCLLVVAGGTLGAVRSWSFELCGVFGNGVKILQAPLTICLRDLAAFPRFFLHSKSFLLSIQPPHRCCFASYQ